MASASSTSARSLFADSKMRLADRVQILMHSTRNFAVQEQAIENSLNNLKRMQLLCTHLGYQQSAMLKSAQQLEEVKEQVCAMQR
ncbi:unnamed protein product [Acanthoscelides obtectus]|uniref:BLOC-1-related complex subunit 7 n=1 Tax=Acanthoscelides obtectus TaxID=200917 RepID=A0A9P0LNA1_ACAOB|nr:unnamed protein product [Acanthoscelides obtectus]CAK1636169.1 hypothetical protein AOBTE_LOCUS9775 [Acanthoscelides obtectus]